VAPAEPRYDLATQVALLTQEVRQVGTAQGAMVTTVEALDRRLDGRPSWAYATILSLSTAMNGALLAAVVALLTLR